MADVTPIAPGALVRLRSGGPIMTVRGTYHVTDPNDDPAQYPVAVAWFDGRELREAEFLPACFITNVVVGAADLAAAAR